VRLAWVVLVGCGRIGFDPAGNGPPGDPNDVTPDIELLGTFGTPTSVSVSEGGPEYETSPTMTGDRAELLWMSTRPGGSEPFLHWHATADATTVWTNVTQLTEFGLLDSDRGMKLSTDNRTMWFGSPRVGSLGARDIWMTTRASRDAAWETPQHVPQLSTASGEFPGGGGDDLHMLLISSRDGSADLFLADRESIDAPWNAPVRIDELSTSATEGSGWIDRTGTIIYFSRTTDGAMEDLYEAKRAAIGEPFGAPVPIVELNTPMAERDPYLSDDRRHIMFTTEPFSRSKLYEATR
jgi:hypothetical protein